MDYHGVVPDFAAVMYKDGDWLGYLLACASLIPQAYIIVHLTVFLSRRQAQDIWCGMGQILCEISNSVIKRILSQPRPLSPVLNMPLESHGMPSAHSQFMGYVSGYTVTEAYFTTYRPLDERLGHAVISLTATALVAFSRWYLWYHSALQVLAGVAVGWVIGTTWYCLSILFRKWGLVAWCCELWPCKLLKVKDTQDDVASEYKLYRHKKVD